MSLYPNLTVPINGNSDKITSKPQESSSIFSCCSILYSKIENTALTILKAAAGLLLFTSHPNLFSASFIAGALLFPDQTGEIINRINIIWENNKGLFAASCAAMLIFALPAKLVIASSLYGSYLGFQLYRSSLSPTQTNENGKQMQQNIY